MIQDHLTEKQIIDSIIEYKSKDTILKSNTHFADCSDCREELDGILCDIDDIISYKLVSKKYISNKTKSKGVFQMKTIGIAALVLVVLGITFYFAKGKYFEKPIKKKTIAKVSKPNPVAEQKKVAPVVKELPPQPVRKLKVTKSSDNFNMVQQNDEIKTNDKSVAKLAVNKNTLIKLKENSEANVEKLIKDSDDNIQYCKINLKKGKILSKVKTLKPGAEYIIKTRTAVMGVRGTVFSVEHTDGDKLNVSVLFGKVETTLTKTNEKIMVGQYKKLIINSEGTVGELLKLDTKDIQELTDMNFSKYTIDRIK